MPAGELPSSSCQQVSNHRALRRTKRQITLDHLGSLFYWRDDEYLTCAGDVERALRREQEAAALRIQTRWRGYRVRAGLHQRKTRVVKIRAAVRIQRAVSLRLAIDCCCSNK